MLIGKLGDGRSRHFENKVMGFLICRYHSALRFDPFLSLACYNNLDCNLDVFKKHLVIM